MALTCPAKDCGGPLQRLSDGDPANPLDEGTWACPAGHVVAVYKQLRGSTPSAPDNDESPVNGDG